MPTNNILLFDQNKGNMMGDTEYNTNQQRLNGVQSGIASSQLQNKFQYQVSLVAYAIASLMYNNGLDANDADAVSAFVSNLSGTLVQKVLDKASTSEAQAGTVDTKWMSPALVKAAIDFTSVQLSGSTMTGPLILNGDPTENLGAATKQYVDNKVGGVIQQVYNGSVVNNTTNNFSINVSNAKLLIMSFYLQNPGTQLSQNNVYINDSTGNDVADLVLNTNWNYSSALFVKTYDNNFASLRSYNRSDTYFGNRKATFNTTFKVRYFTSTVYFTAYAMF